VDELSLAIAGIRTEVRTRDPRVPGVVRDRYRRFLSPGTPDWRIEMDVLSTPGLSSDDDVVVARDGGPARFRVTRGDFAGMVDLAQGCASLTLADANPYAIDSFLRVLYSLALLEAQGLVVHAASVIRDGRAYLFCGHSGSGKTTITRLSPDATLLSDELSIVRIVERQVRCYGTPFWGELARAGEDRAALLAGIYYLHHGSRHALGELRPKQALQRLLPNVLFFARDSDLTARVLSLAAELVEAVPCFTLAFRLDPGFWKVIDRG
jgi:hypothetical protein